MNVRILRMCERTHPLCGRKDKPRGEKGHAIHTLRIVRGLHNRLQPVTFGFGLRGVQFMCEDVTREDRHGLWRLALPECRDKVKQFFAILERG